MYNYFDSKVQQFWEKIGTHAVMTLSTCSNHRVTAQPMSVIVYNQKFYCQTDKTYLKFKQISDNPNVSLCVDNFSIEGKCRCIGIPLDIDNTFFVTAFKKYYPTSFIAYSNIPTERLLEITPTLIYSWNYKFTTPYIEYINFIEKSFRKEYK